MNLEQISVLQSSNTTSSPPTMTSTTPTTSSIHDTIGRIATITTTITVPDSHNDNKGAWDADASRAPGMFFFKFFSSANNFYN